MSKFIKRLQLILAKMDKDNITAFAAQTAFFLILSSVPFMLLVVTIIQNTFISVQSIVKFIELLLPEEFAPYALQLMARLLRNSAGTISFSVVMALWSSSNGMQCLSNALIQIYSGDTKKPAWIKLKLRSIICTILVLFGIFFGIVFTMFGKQLLALITKSFHFEPILLTLTVSARHLILFLILFILFLLALRFFPNKKARLVDRIPAAFFSSLLWILLSLGISAFSKVFGNSSTSIYGNLATVTLLLFWIYFGIYLFLIVCVIDDLYGKKIHKELMRYISVKKSMYALDKELRKIRKKYP